MKKKLIMALCGCLVSAMILAACGKSASIDSSSMSWDGKYEVPMESIAGGTVTAENGFASDFEYSAEEDGTGNMVSQLTFNENVKLIFRADLRLQTLNYQETEQSLNNLVAQYEGYFESMYTDNGSYYSSGEYKSGSYVVRIPSGKYDSFLSAVGEGCHVVSLNKSTEDVGLEYSDIETRLETLNTKMERLKELLKKADKMEDIIQLESAISDCQYQIDSLSSQKNRYDSLIGYSTININLEQVRNLDGSVTEDKGFLQELGENFTRGLKQVGYNLEELAYWAAYNIVGIVIAVAVFLGLGKFLKKHARKPKALRNPFRKHSSAGSADPVSNEIPKEVKDDIE